jgi:hypothetical protein
MWYATLHPDQPRAQRIDAPNGLGGSLLARLADLGGNRRCRGLAQTQIPRAGATAKSADAAHVRGLLIKQAGVSKVHSLGSSRLTFIDRWSPRSPGSSRARGLFLETPPLRRIRAMTSACLLPSLPEEALAWAR